MACRREQKGRKTETKVGDEWVGILVVKQGPGGDNQDRQRAETQAK